MVGFSSFSWEGGVFPVWLVFDVTTVCVLQSYNSADHFVWGLVFFALIPRKLLSKTAHLVIFFLKWTNTVSEMEDSEICTKGESAENNIRLYFPTVFPNHLICQINMRVPVQQSKKASLNNSIRINLWDNAMLTYICEHGTGAETRRLQYWTT